MARILIIDDDYEIVSLLVEILKHEGHEVEHAGEPVTGMQKARALKPDMMILDYHMPGATGAHLFENLRRNQATANTPILFMSGEASPEDILAEISDSYGSRFLPKPVHLEEFRKAVRDMLASRPGSGVRAPGTLVLVRHGQSQWNLENRFTGWVDVPITEKGAREAEQAAEDLRGLRFDCAFTSELKRAQQTLDILLDRLGQKNVPIERSAAINERHYGDLQGLDKTETAKKYGKDQVHIWRRSFDIKPPNGESLKDTADRSLPYFREKILPKAAGGANVLVAAHGNSLRAIIMDLEKLSPEQIMEVNIDTCRPVFYEIGPGGEVLSKREAPARAA
jgi:2,3-bisphosphoglycerate-dependent phosphoglycerate mutase